MSRVVGSTTNPHIELPAEMHLEDQVGGVAIGMLPWLPLMTIVIVGTAKNHPCAAMTAGAAAGAATIIGLAAYIASRHIGWDTPAGERKCINAIPFAGAAAAITAILITIAVQTSEAGRTLPAWMGVTTGAAFAVLMATILAWFGGRDLTVKDFEAAQRLLDRERTAP